MTETDLPISQPENAPAFNWPSPGQMLKKKREELGLSHGRVADALHMTAHYVKALESDQYDKLPGKTFVKGYFRSYARLLGADVEEIMLSYERFTAALEKSEETEANVIRAKKAYDQNMRWMVCAAAIIVVVMAASWWFSRSKASDAVMAEFGAGAIAEIPETPVQTPVTAAARMAGLAERTGGHQAGMSSVKAAMPIEDTVAADAVDSVDAAARNDNDGVVLATTEEIASAGLAEAAEAAENVVDTLAASTEASQSGLPDYTVIEQDNSRVVQLESDGEDMLEVHFTGASWIEVDNGDSIRLYNDMLDTGDDLSIRGKAPFNVLVGDANVVDMTFNSRAVDITARMRNDNSARIVLEPETN